MKEMILTIDSIKAISEKYGESFCNQLIDILINKKEENNFFIYDEIIKTTLNELGFSETILKAKKEICLDENVKKCNKVTRVFEKSNFNNYKQASFTAIIARSQIYKDYDCEDMSQYEKNKYYDLCLMLYRWDGKIGFIGGLNDDLDIISTCIKESMEEAGLQLERKKIKYLSTHLIEDKNILSHFNVYDLGILELHKLKEILIKSCLAEHCISEGNVIWTRLDNFRINSNILCDSVKEEMLLLKEKINSEKVT